MFGEWLVLFDYQLTTWKTLKYGQEFCSVSGEMFDQISSPGLTIPGGGGELTCPWYGVVPFLGYLFQDRFRIYGYGFQQFLAFSGFMSIVLCKNSFIGELFLHFGYDFQQILQNYGYTFEIFLRIYGWYFYDLNGTTPYLGNSSYPPPRAYNIR